jgi:glycosyltransferase involved in cell wall biosynthesis
MNVLFLTIIRINKISDRGIYSDLMRKFCDEGHKVFIISPVERKHKQDTTLIIENNATILKIKTLNIQKSNPVEKLFATLLINFQFFRGIKKYFSEIRFDLVIYSTPPITFTKLVNYVKKQDGVVSYLLLKDIFPQNAVDLRLIRKGGFLHNYFLRKEKDLYEISDYIGCMSQASIDYLLMKHPDINPEKIEINPNSHELFEETITMEQKRLVRQKYRIATDATVFIYGGNLGKPQGINFVIEFLNAQKNKNGVFILIIGSGTEYYKLKRWFDLEQPHNALLISELQKDEYNLLLKSSDVGMIFLDSCFTIPNFPSRMLSYLEYKIPVIAATDKNTDIGKIMEENCFGLWSESGDLDRLDKNINRLSQNSDLRKMMGLNGFEYFIKNHTVSTSYNIIIKHFNRS